MDTHKIEAGFRLVLEGLDLDLNEAQLRNTPERTATTWVETLCRGLSQPPYRLSLLPNLQQEAQGLSMVCLNQIPVLSLCAHHLLPFWGLATVAFIPAKTLCGLADLSKLVDYFARRPQLQEQLTQQVALSLQEQMQTLGVAVCIKASHGCMTMRGVQHEGRFTTLSFLGQFQQENNLKQHFLQMAQQST